MSGDPYLLDGHCKRTRYGQTLPLFEPTFSRSKVPDSQLGLLVQWLSRFVIFGRDIFVGTLHDAGRIRRMQDLVGCVRPVQFVEAFVLVRPGCVGGAGSLSRERPVLIDGGRRFRCIVVLVMWYGPGDDDEL